MVSHICCHVFETDVMLVFNIDVVVVHDDNNGSDTEL